MSCGILVTQPGIKPVPSALEVCALNHCTVREVPKVARFLGKMVLSQQEGLDSSSLRTAPQGFLSQDLLPLSLLLCACCECGGPGSATPWPAVRQAPLSFTLSWSLLRFMSIELVMLPNHFILCPPLTLHLRRPKY